MALLGGKKTEGDITSILYRLPFAMLDHARARINGSAMEYVFTE